MTSQSEAIQALSVAVRGKVPVLLWGGPGTGKSSMIRSLGASLDLPVVTVIASLREPADFAGLPVVSDDGSIRLAEPAWARTLAQAGSGILFLDEITTAPPAVQAALLRVVLERVVGEVELPPGIAVIAAANPPEIAAGGWDLSPPLANRFCHIDWPVDSDRYLESLSAGWGTGGIEPRSEVTSDTSGVQVRSVLAGFLRSRPTLLYSMPEDVTSSGRAWPSPRSWDMAAELWARADEEDLDPGVVTLLLSGCVGAGAARELLVWQQEADLPDPEDVLANPGSFRLPDRGDRQFAVLTALAAAVKNNPTKDRWEAAFSVVEQAVSRGAPDIAAVAARSLAQNIPEGVTALPTSVGSLAPVLAKAKILRRNADR